MSILYKTQDSKAEQLYGRLSKGIDFLSVKILTLGATIKCFLKEKEKLKPDVDTTNKVNKRGAFVCFRVYCIKSIRGRD